MIELCIFLMFNVCIDSNTHEAVPCDLCITVIGVEPPHSGERE